MYNMRVIIWKSDCICKEILKQRLQKQKFTVQVQFTFQIHSLDYIYINIYIYIYIYTVLGVTHYK